MISHPTNSPPKHNNTFDKQGGDLKRALGLMHENFYIDNPIYDENNNLASARVRIYSVNTSVGTDNDVIGTYLITSNSIGTGKFTSWSQIVI